MGLQPVASRGSGRSEEHTSELQSRSDLVCRLLLEKKKQRLMNAMRQAHADGWFIVFDTLTLADDRLEAFYDNPNALRDYFRDIDRMVLAAEGLKANDSHADCYQYFCVLFFFLIKGRPHISPLFPNRTLSR